MYGELHHSEGYPQTMSSAELWWGPDFRKGVCREIKNRVDIVPSITKVFNVDAVFAAGRIMRKCFGSRFNPEPVLQSRVEFCSNQEIVPNGFLEQGSRPSA